MTGPDPFDHLRPTDAHYEAGVYRVVGTDDDAVTLLRVGDANGQRVTTGQIRRVPIGDLEGFEPAPNPDGSRGLWSGVSSLPGTLYWSVIAFGQQLRRRPIPAAGATAVLLLGAVGEGVFGLSEPLPTMFVFAGAFGLTVLGSGRL